MEEFRKDQPHDRSLCGGWCGCGHSHFLLRWILGILILATVFCVGGKVGEVKQLLRSFGYGYGYGYMDGPRHMYQGYMMVRPQLLPGTPGQPPVINQTVSTTVVR